MGKFEDLLELLMADDDEVETEVEIHLIDSEDEEPKEEPKGKHEPKEEEAEDMDDDMDVEKLRGKAKEQYKKNAKEFGEEMANAIVDYASYCAMIVNLVRCDIPIDYEIVDHYNDLCKKVHPESCNPMVKAVAYVAMQEMIKEGKKSLG